MCGSHFESLGLKACSLPRKFQFPRSLPGCESILFSRSQKRYNSLTLRKSDTSLGMVILGTLTRSYSAGKEGRLASASLGPNAVEIQRGAAVLLRGLLFFSMGVSRPGQWHDQACRPKRAADSCSWAAMLPQVWLENRFREKWIVHSALARYRHSSRQVPSSASPIT